MKGQAPVEQAGEELSTCIFSSWEALYQQRAEILVKGHSFSLKFRDYSFYTYFCDDRAITGVHEKGLFLFAW